MSLPPNVIFGDVIDELNRQQKKWGIQNHKVDWYYLILAEEVGEVAKGILEQESVSHIREELIQVAAVAIAMIDSLDRNKR